MDISLLSMAATAVSSATAATSDPATAEPSSFEELLQTAQAPPGPEPPPLPDAKGEKEQQTSEPNAQSIQPDLSSPTEKEPSSDKTKKPAAASPTTPNTLASAATLSASVTEAIPLPTAKGLSKTSETTYASSVKPRPKTDTVPLKELPTSGSTQIVSAKAATEGSAPAGPPQTEEGTPPYTQVAPPPQMQQTIPSSTQSTAETQAGESEASSAQAAIPKATAAAGDPSAATTIAEQQVPATASVGPTGEKPNSGSGQNPQTGGGSQPSPDLAQVAKTAGAQMSGGGNTPSQNGQGPTHSPAQQLPAQNMAVVKQMADHADSMALARSASNVTVHLQSDDETNVTLMVKSGHGEVQAQIMTNNESLKDSLHQNQNQLALKLESKGMNLGQVSVGLKGSGGGQERTPQQQGAKISAPIKTSNMTASAQVLAATTAKGVDLTI